MKIHRVSTINKIIFITLAAVFITFCLMIMLAANILLKDSMDNAKKMDKAHAEHIVNSVKNNLNNITSLLFLTQQVLGALDPHSVEAELLADKSLTAMLDFNLNVYCAWFIFEKGAFYEDRYYSREFIKQNDLLRKMENYEAEE